MRDTLIAQGKAKLVWHNFPFLGMESVWAAEAAECARDQGRFWEYHDKLYEEQGPENSGAFTKPRLETFARQLGLNSRRFNSCLKTDSKIPELRKEFQDAQAKSVRATPTVFVAGQQLENPLDYNSLEQAIEQAVGR